MQKLDEFGKKSFKEINNQSEINEAKRTIHNWQEEMKKRNELFVKYFRSKILHDAFHAELQKETPSLPRRIQPIRIENEPEEEYLIRHQLAKDKLQSEMKLHEIRYMKHTEDITNIDVEMIKSIQASDLNSQLIESQINCWKKEALRREENNKEKVLKNFTWYKKHCTTDPRPSKLDKQRIQNSHENGPEIGPPCDFWQSNNPRRNNWTKKQYVNNKRNVPKNTNNNYDGRKEALNNDVNTHPGNSKLW